MTHLTKLIEAAKVFDEDGVKGAATFDHYTISSVANIHTDRMKRNCFENGAQYQHTQTKKLAVMLEKAVEAMNEVVNDFTRAHGLTSPPLPIMKLQWALKNLEAMCAEQTNNQTGETK